MASILRPFSYVFFSLSPLGTEPAHGLIRCRQTTWNGLKKVFLSRYFSPSKMAQMRNQITYFRQRDGESLFEAWERYKDLLRACPHHGLEKWLIIHTFYNGLLYNTRMTIDAAARGALMNKPFTEAWGLIEDMAQNHYQWGSERALAEKGQPKAGMYEVSSFDHLSAKFDVLYKNIGNLTITPPAPVADVAPNCEICGIPGHTPTECHLLVKIDQANYAHGNPYGQRNPNFPYNNNNHTFCAKPCIHCTVWFPRSPCCSEKVKP